MLAETKDQWSLQNLNELVPLTPLPEVREYGEDSGWLQWNLTVNLIEAEENGSRL